MNNAAATHSVTPQSWKTSGSALTRHSLQTRRTLGSGVTGGSSISLKRRWIKMQKVNIKVQSKTRQCCVMRTLLAFSLPSARVYLSTIVSISSGGTTGTGGSNEARCTTLTGETSVTLNKTQCHRISHVEVEVQESKKLSDCNVDDIPQ